MDITPQTPISTIVTEVPAAIAVLQKYGVAFCCTGSTPLSAACAHHEIDAARLIADIETARAPRASRETPDQTMRDVIAHIQQRYHQPLRDELPRLSLMLAKVVLRHGERMPDVLVPLQSTFERFHDELLEHMEKEDQGIFPAIAGLEAGASGSQAVSQWLRDPLNMLVADHRGAEAALARMRELTDSYTPPADACPTFRGVYYGLAELERDMQIHIHLENDILFPRALARARA
jgi:regulator of cell morphogenesis and NO signaling